ncbi:MAG TPA: DUF983 domain-containing protein [Actinomycetota bacterium]|nr:DUF983 domain-containing protein [Actinomycetota bacterium]
MADPSGPWDLLEPPAREREPTRTHEPGATRAILRGAIRRCPRCGAGGLFEGWFKIRHRCPRCALRLEREEGGFLGAMTLNYVVTASGWLALLIAWLAIDLPEVNVAALLVSSLVLVTLLPLAFWPFSKTIWAALDFLVYRSSPDYVPRDAAERAPGNGGRFSASKGIPHDPRTVDDADGAW